MELGIPFFLRSVLIEKQFMKLSLVSHRIKDPSDYEVWVSR